MKKPLFVLLTVIFTASLSFASSDEGKKLFERKCDSCHSTEPALNKIKTLEEWMRTAKRMARRSGGAITLPQAEKIAVFLAENSKKIKDSEKTAEKKEETPLKSKAFEFKKVQVSQFIEPSVCGECHSEKYKQWSGSMHSKAFTDPLWRAATKLFIKEVSKEGELLEMKACVKCHTPLGFRSDLISSPKDDYDKLAALPAQGIFCNWCHNINEVKHIGDSGYEVEPGGGMDNPSTMLGPLKDAESDFHPTKYSELHTRSEFCGLCHNVSHAANKMPIEMTYEEWRNSPYNTGNPETTVNCQDCHMRQRPGIPATGKTARPDNPGKAADNGPDRPQIYTHYFVGGNAIVTKLLGSEVHSKMAVERLQNAADLEIIKDGSYKKGVLSQVRIKVTNSGAGHYLPTGITEVRQMWLDVKITDAKGKTVFRSGEIDKNGSLDENAVLYHTKLGNEKGEPVLNPALADRVFYDYRIPPKGFVIEKYAFVIPPDAVSPIRIETTLKYRSISQPLANSLLGKNAPEIPVIDMVSATEKIEF